MDIRYFEFLDRLKHGDKSDDNACLRGEKDNHTRLLTDELGVRIPPEAQIPPHLVGPADESLDRAERRAKMVRVARQGRRNGLYDSVEHMASQVFAKEHIQELTSRRVVMFITIDKFDQNQCCVKCPCGKEFDDWATLFHTCPECGAVDEGV